MELSFIKEHALDALKKGLPQTFGKYFTERDNSWLADICGENPFVKFRDVPDFELAPLNAGLTEGKIDFDNCKILYSRLSFLTPRQAADERFWAGLCHGTFYGYVRRRWGYDKGIDPSADTAKIITGIKNRFFFSGGARQRLLTNTLSKYWWARKIFSSDDLNVLGATDFYTKIFSIMTRSFIGNEKLRGGFMKFLRHFKDRGITLNINNHVRPAMSELNKRGGAVVLDCLSEDEVAAIMIEHVEKIFPRKVINVPVKVVDVPKKISVGTSKIIPRVEVSCGRTVKFGDLVTMASMDGGRPRHYRPNDTLKKNHPEIFNGLLGKGVGSTVTLKDGKYQITEIK